MASRRLQVIVVTSLCAACIGSAIMDRELLATVDMVSTPEHLQEIIDLNEVSLVMFTEGEDETPETQWFQALVSHLWDGPGLVFAMVDNHALKKEGRRGAEGIYLFVDRDSDRSTRLPMTIASEPEARNAVAFVQGALEDANAVRGGNVWLKPPAALPHGNDDYRAADVNNLATAEPKREL